MLEFPCKECGSINKIPESWLDLRRRPRSSKHSRKFFACIGAAFYHWPHAEPYPVNEHHLRAYLLCAAGHCDIFTQTLGYEDDVDCVVDFTNSLLRKVGYGFAEPSGRRTLLVKIPRTINHTVVDQDDFNPISQKVFEIICVACNVSDIDELQRNTPSEVISAKNREES